MYTYLFNISILNLSQINHMSSVTIYLEKMIIYGFISAYSIF